MSAVYVISCSTGCSCCSYENHYRGPYKTKEDAERRIAYYRTDGNFHPVASQYSKRGVYKVKEVDVENISEGRVILCGCYVAYPSSMEIIEVAEDGTVKDNGTELFDEIGECY